MTHEQAQDLSIIIAVLALIIAVAGSIDWYEMYCSIRYFFKYRIKEIRIERENKRKYNL